MRIILNVQANLPLDHKTKAKKLDINIHSGTKFVAFLSVCFCMHIEYQDNPVDSTGFSDSLSV